MKEIYCSVYGMNDKLFDYLSLRWFFYGAGDGYNPAGPGGNM